MRVLVTGAAGSGTTTLAAALAHRSGAALFDADNFFWLPTEPPFIEKRSPVERRVLLAGALEKHPSCVVAGSVMGWGAEIEDAFDAIVFLYVKTEVRLERLIHRETERFGRVDPAFLAWAAQYDTGPVEGRSLAKHNVWLAQRRSRLVRLDGNLQVTELVSRLMALAPI